MRLGELGDLSNRYKAILANPEFAGILDPQHVECTGTRFAHVLRRVQRLRETGVIERDVAIVSPKVFGKKMMVIVLLTMERDRPDRYMLMREEFGRMPEVVQCHHVTGAHDFVLRIQVSDMEEYSAFVDRVFHEPYIKRYESLAVLGSLK